LKLDDCTFTVSIRIRLDTLSRKSDIARFRARKNEKLRSSLTIEYIKITKEVPTIERELATTFTIIKSAYVLFVISWYIIKYNIARFISHLLIYIYTI